MNGNWPKSYLVLFSWFFGIGQNWPVLMCFGSSFHCFMKKDKSHIRDFIDFFMHSLLHRQRSKDPVMESQFLSKVFSISFYGDRGAQSRAREDSVASLRDSRFCFIKALNFLRVNFVCKNEMDLQHISLAQRVINVMLVSMKMAEKKVVQRL